MPFSVGGCVVFAFHDVCDAPSLHAQFKESRIDAAVIDHAFFLSPLQLAVAWKRAQQDALFDKEKQSHHRHAREPVARGLFLGLSVSNQLHRALQVLTAGPATTAVVVLVRESDLTDARRQRIEQVARACHATAHEIDPVIPGHVRLATSTADNGVSGATESTSPTTVHVLSRLVEPRRVSEYYQISDAEVRAARRSFNNVDESRLRRQCEEAGIVMPGSGPAWDELLNLKALEVCIVQKLALYGC